MKEFKRFLPAILLIIVAVASFGYAAKEWRENKSEIIIQAADFLEVLALPYRVAKLSAQPRDTRIPIPVQGVLFTEIEDSWGAPRAGGRTHKGVDIFASRGTPVYAAADGYVIRTGESELGGNFVYTVGAGGVRYYYAHLDSIAISIKYGLPVTTNTIIGYVGNTGNASTTPAHLHLGMYIPGEGSSNPFPLIVSRRPR
jgi:murein DD-endopeptidase MepM/ murein hydrolase activator NlpD